MSEVIQADEVLSQEDFGDTWAYVMDRYGEDDARLTQGYLILRAISAVLEKELGIKRMEVTVEDAE